MAAEIDVDAFKLLFLGYSSSQSKYYFFTVLGGGEGPEKVSLLNARENVVNCERPLAEYLVSDISGFSISFSYF